MPPWVPAALRDALARRGLAELWSHQAQAATAAFNGEHVAIATGTASGKTLAYLLPVLTGCLTGEGGRPRLDADRRSRLRLSVTPRKTALYLAPTKALAHDQLRAITDLGLTDVRACALDGDSGGEERRFARDFGHYVLTNPDMLHRSVLPQHQRWSRLLGDLSYVVIDEAHRYKGVFGAHVAMVLRRLRRLAHHYGADPVFVFASATIAAADQVGADLAGLEAVTLVDQDASPASSLDFVVRRPTDALTADAGRLLASLSESGQTLAFTTSRVQAEVIALRAKEHSRRPDTIAAYRGGYLAEDRRSLERQLQTGTLRGVACTNALELGVDIAGMDAVMCVGFPGTLAALWQQVGRAGRSGHDALAVLMARQDPLDAYLSDHPALIFDRTVERTVLDPANPYVLGPHLAAAAQETPLTHNDERYFGPTMAPVAEALSAQGVLRRRGDAWYWPHAGRAVDSIDLRAMQGAAVDIVDATTGNLLGQVDPSATDRTLHPEAIYVHQGEHWLVTDLDEVNALATVVPARPDYFTQPRSLAGIQVLATERRRSLGLGEVCYGTIELSNQVIGYLRRDAQTGDVWDQNALDMPLRTMTTKAVWWSLPPDVVGAIDVTESELPGGVHAAEHAAIGLLPALITCDRWDIGGLSTVLHPDTGRLTVFVHDGAPGGTGFAEQGYEVAERWWAMTLERLTTCDCDEGCPACVVSPKCGNGNEPLDKRAAAELVRVLTLG